MPGLFRPTFQDKSGKTKKTKKWYGWITTADGRRIRKPLASDKSVAQQMLAKLISQTEREDAGIIDHVIEASKQSLDQHLAEWEADLLSKARERAQRTAKQTAERARVVFAGCGVKKVHDIRVSAVEQFVATLKHGAQTKNYYLRSCKQFCRWMLLDRRITDNPLLTVKFHNVKLDRRHDRRALTHQEIDQLLAATKASGWVWRGLTGLDRHVLYATAMQTGLRVSELASLTVGDFDLDGAVVRVKAAYTKNQQEVEQPLPAELVEVLRSYLYGRRNNEVVWPGTWSERSSWMISKDYAAAGVPYKLDGLVVDFHALRHTYITLLVKSGVQPRMAMSLARHSDINLTMKVYTHVGLADQHAALEAFPSLTQAVLKPGVSMTA